VSKYSGVRSPDHCETKVTLAVQAFRRRCCLIRTREVSHSELDLTVGKLPPFLHNRHVPDVLTWLTEDFASFAAGRFDRQRKYFWLPRAMHPVC
jgi:hypothetical protein